MKYIIKTDTDPNLKIFDFEGQCPNIKHFDSSGQEHSPESISVASHEYYNNIIKKKYPVDQYKNYNVLMVTEFQLEDDLIDLATLLHGKPNLIYNEFYTKIDLDTKIPVCLLNYFFTEYAPQALKLSIVDSAAVDTCSPFNFMVNRKRINRHLMIKILEYFDLIKHAKYTWSKVDVNYDLSIIVQELDSIEDVWAQDIRSTILSPINLDQNWISTAKDVVSPKSNIKSSATDAWNQGLCSIFNDTAVSLISESVDYQSGIGFTEKSMYAVLGLNLPIWVGGKYQASEFEKLGFDVFDDIIDHSYQYCDTLIERCYRAIADNLDILSNLDLAAKTRQNVMPRLLKNQQLMLSMAADKHMQYQCVVNSIAAEHVPAILKDMIKRSALLRIKPDFTE
jgi:hypothetical protein